MMSGIRGRDTAPEWTVRRYLHAAGLRFRVHVRGLPGTPDLVFSSRKVIIFVHGCFWHRHSGCRFATTPSTRPQFWEAKFHANVARDRRHQESLRQLGWAVITVWECELGSTTFLDELCWRVLAGGD